ARSRPVVFARRRHTRGLHYDGLWLLGSPLTSSMKIPQESFCELNRILPPSSLRTTNRVAWPANYTYNEIEASIAIDAVRTVSAGQESGGGNVPEELPRQGPDPGS